VVVAGGVVEERVAGGVVEERTGDGVVSCVFGAAGVRSIVSVEERTDCFDCDSAACELVLRPVRARYWDAPREPPEDVDGVVDFGATAGPSASCVPVGASWDLDLRAPVVSPADRLDEDCVAC
jgi:hypothetical protein